MAASCDASPSSPARLYVNDVLHGMVMMVQVSRRREVTSRAGCANASLAGWRAGIGDAGGQACPPLAGAPRQEGAGAHI